MVAATTRPWFVWVTACMLAACSNERVDLGSGAHSDDPDLHPGLVPPVATPSPSETGMPVPPPVPRQPIRLAAVVTADVAPPPISGGTLAVADDGSVAVAADPDRDAVYVVGLADSSVRTVALAQGSEPGRVVLDGAGYAHVALRSAGGLARIDTANAKLERTTQLCGLPRGLAYDAASDRLWVACATGELVSVDASTHVERSRAFVAPDLRDVLIDGSGTLFVSRFRTAELLQIGADGSIAARQMPFSTQQGLDLGAPQGVFATSPTQAWRTIRGPDGMPWMLHQRSRDDAISAAGGWSSDRANAITRPRFTRFGGDASAQTNMPLSAFVTLPVDIASSADGRWLAVADPAQYLDGGPSVFVMPVAALAQVAMPAPSSMAPPAMQPMSSLDCACSGLLAMAEPTQATSVAFDRAGLLYAFSREPATLDVFSVVTDAGGPIGSKLHAMQSITLSDRSVRDTGHEIFHADVGSGLACASCHGEALDDGHVWDFAELGQRRTQNLRGGLLGTLPLHWQGEFATFRDLVGDVLTTRMGGFLAKDEYKDALGNWLDKQPELRHDSDNPAGVARGKQLFESKEVGCTDCHSGAELTNNQTVDVGTGGAFQVPSLRGVSLRAPYMHDGCAHTLEERFTPGCGGDSRHGNTAQLTAAERADLIAFLASL